MSYPINYPTPQGANVQIFTTDEPLAGNEQSNFNWVKPQGASFVWFTLIGPGGRGDEIAGGGSGAVTNFMCPAFLIPDNLTIFLGVPTHRAASISYTLKTDGTSYLLLKANNGNDTFGGAATVSNAFTAMGFYQSIAGQNGSSGAPTTPTTTFVQAGGGSTGTTGNYGYQSSGIGYFQMQPIICTVGANNGANPANAGIGGGGSRINLGGKNGGPGMAVIITW